MVPTISQETLSEMVGTTRSRVNFLMGKFRKLGFIEQDGGVLHVKPSLLHVVHDGNRGVSNGTNPIILQALVSERRHWPRAG